MQSLDGIDKLEVWHDDTGLGRGWFADYISLTDNKTGEEACFFIGEYLNNENGGVEQKHLILDKQTGDNRPCREHQFDAKESTIQESLIRGNLPSPYKQTYRIETKTGNISFYKFELNEFQVIRVYLVWVQQAQMHRCLFVFMIIMMIYQSQFN